MKLVVRRVSTFCNLTRVMSIEGIKRHRKHSNLKKTPINGFIQAVVRTSLVRCRMCCTGGGLNRPCSALYVLYRLTPPILLFLSSSSCFLSHCQRQERAGGAAWTPPGCTTARLPLIPRGPRSSPAKAPIPQVSFTLTDAGTSAW